MRDAHSRSHPLLSAPVGREWTAGWSDPYRPDPGGGQPSAHFCELWGPLGDHAARRRADPCPLPACGRRSSRATSRCLPSALTGSWQDTVVPQRLAGYDSD